jgi:hypothetical protein
VGVSVIGTTTYSQSLVDARALTLGAYTSAVRDTREFPANPGGLVQMRDWDFGVTTYTGTDSKSFGFVFHALSFGKRLYGGGALAVRYAPGEALTLVLPTTLFIAEGNIPASNDREIRYREPFALGFGHRILPSLSTGLGVRYRREEVADTRYTLVLRDTISYPSASLVTYASASWLADLGLQWTAADRLTVAAVARNLLNFRHGDTGDPIDAYLLPISPAAEVGVGYTPFSDLSVFASGSTCGNGALSAEWLPGMGLSVRGSLFMDRRDASFMQAFSTGLGWTYEFLDIDAGYLHFFDRSSHTGTTPAASFDPANITNLDLNPYSRDRLSLSLKVIFGHVRQSLARIEEVKLFGGIYPSSYEMLAYQPIGNVRVKNISAKPIHAKASFFVDRVMDVPTESQPVYILPDQEAEIPLTAVFNEQVKRVQTLTVREGNVFVNATPAEEYDDKRQTTVLFHGKNAWNGDVNTLRFFVTPDDPAILRYSRDVLLQYRDSLSGISGMLERFTKARVLINTFAGRLLYVGDPKQSADFVQYPSETLTTLGGDCDDMTVCFASLLSSIGVSTAFVDVLPPERPADGHIFLLFDTGVEPRYGSHVSENPKRYVVRRNQAGVETLWLPIETTMITKGFDEAWTRGAQRYFDDVEVGLGLVKGWVHIVDVN